MTRRLAFFLVWIALGLAALPALAQPQPLVIPVTFGNPRVGFSPDASQLALFEDAGYAQAMEITPNADNTAILLYDPATGDKMETLAGARDYAAALLFTPDGSRIITAHANGDVMTWDAASGDLLSSVRTPVFSTRTPLFWHPVTGELVIASQNQYQNSYMTLDPATGALNLLSIAPAFITYSEFRAQTSELGPRQRMHTVVVPAPHSEALAELPLASDAVWTVNPQGQVALLSLGTGEEQVLRDGGEYPMFNVTDLVATPSGLVGFTVNNEDQLMLFNLLTGEESEIAVAHQSALLSPDGEQIAQYNADETSLLLSSVDGSKTGALAFPDGLAAGPRFSLRLYYSPGGSRLAATGLKDADEQNVIVIYDL